MSELLQGVDAALNWYISQCYNAQETAPDEWKQFWADEAAAASATKRAITGKIQMFIDYAAGKPVEMLGQRPTRKR